MKKAIISTEVPTLTASVTPSKTPRLIPGMPTEVATQVANNILNPLQQSQFICLFSSGDGADGGTVVFLIPWPQPCSGALWISGNENGFSSEAVPTTIVFSRTFTVSPSLIPNSIFSINFGIDDESIFVLSNVSHPAGVTIASGGGQFCHGVSFDGSLLEGNGGNNTLTIYVINTVSVPVGGNFGYTGVNYQVCAQILTPVETPTFTNTPTPTDTPIPTNTFTETPTMTNTPQFTFTPTPEPCEECRDQYQTDLDGINERLQNALDIAQACITGCSRVPVIGPLCVATCRAARGVAQDVAKAARATARQNRENCFSEHECPGGGE